MPANRKHANRQAYNTVTSHLIAAADGWRVSDLWCAAGPEDKPFEEAHEWVSVAAVRSGSFVYRSIHGREVMTAGSMLLGNQNACFCCSHEHSTGDRCIAFHYDPAMVEEVASGIAGVRRSTFNTHRIPLLYSTLRLQAETGRLSASSDRMEVETIAVRMLAAALDLSNNGEVECTTFSDERRALDATAYIDRRFDESISLSDLAGSAGLSRHHFLRVFRRVVGVTPYRYLLRRRLLKAAAYLDDPSVSVTEAALGSGFGDLSDFNRRFRNHFAATPTQYRNRHR